MRHLRLASTALLALLAVAGLARADTVGGVEDRGYSRTLHTDDGGALHVVVDSTTSSLPDGGTPGVAITSTVPVQGVDGGYHLEVNDDTLDATAAAIAATKPGSLVQVGGNDGTNAYSLKTDTSGNLFVKRATAASPTYGEVAVLAASATAVPATPLAGRQSLLIQNNGPNNIWCGLSNAVTTGTGVKIEKNGGFWSDDSIGAQAVYCKAETAAQTAGATPGTATNYQEH